MDGVDGLILSAETATGSYVLESLDTMRRIALQAEKNYNYADYQVIIYMSSVINLISLLYFCVVSAVKNDSFCP